MNEQKEISLKFTNKITGEKKLERYAQQLSIVKSAMQGMDQGVVKSVEDSAKSMATTAKATEGMAKKVNLAFNYTAIRTFGRALKNVVVTMTDLVTQSSSFLEDFNLFQVAFNGNYQSAERFVNKLSEMYGLDEGWLTRTTGIFKQLANAMDLSVETGERLSELMTQMSIDISSLYNVDVDRASQVLQSALAGQTKPIRGLTGGDITQATLQTTLDKLDIGGAVNQLSFAEKRLLIIISLTQQLEESAGDWGRTLESPANQLRILNEQWTRLGRAVGNLFLPILAEVLPYLNAVLMVLTEIIGAIATLLGFNLEDYDYFGSATGSAWDFDDALESAGNSAGKLKNKLSGLRSFDKLNVINTPSSSGGASGGGVGTGINPKLMEAFNKAFEDYQNKLDDVQMKATRIRDSIMEWLGFQKEINEETGKTTWVYTESNTKMGELISTLLKSGGSVLELITEIGGSIYNVLKSPTGETIFNYIYDNCKNTLEIIDNISSSLTKAFKKDNKGYKIFDSIAKTFGSILKYSNSISSTLKNWTASPSFQEAMDNILGILQDVFSTLSDTVDWLVEMYDKYISPVMADLLILISEVINAIKPIWDVVEPIIKNIIEAIKKSLEPRIEKITSLIKDVIKILTGLAEFVKGVFTLDWETAWQGIEDVFEGVTDFLYDKCTFILSFFDGTWEGIKTVYSGVEKFFKNIFSKAWEEIKEIWNNPQDFFEGVIDGIGETFRRGFELIKKTISNIWDKILGLFTTGGDIFKGITEGVGDIFKKIVNGLIDGINWVVSKPFDIINGLLNKIKTFEIFEIQPFYNAWGYNPIPVPEIPKLKLGGMPEVGQMFIANEKGPELIGQIGGQSFVANQNQMMDLLDKKIGNAQSKQGTQIYNIYLDENHKIGTYTLEQLQGMAKSNGKPITIG